MRRLGLISAIVVTFGAIFTASASAHTKLVSSTPGRDARVTAPTEVRLVFSEQVMRAQVQIRDARGGSHQAGAAQVRDATVTQKVVAGLAAGAYTVDYRVVSADGHPVEESLPFAIIGTTPAANGPDGQGTNAEAAASGGQPAGSGGSAKWFMVGAGLFGGIGIGIVLVFLRNRKSAGTRP